MSLLSSEFRTSLEQATAKYQAALGSHALNYLAGRGINPAVADDYRLGEVDGSVPEHAAYQGWISIPYDTRLGGVVSLKFGRTDGGEPKYVGPYPTRIYNALAFDKAEGLGYIGICEGEMDTMTADGLCHVPCVGIPGVETWKAHPEWRELFTGFSKVLIFADPDDPGKALANRIMRELDTAHLVSLPGGDVNATFLRYGAETIRKAAGL